MADGSGAAPAAGVAPAAGDGGAASGNAGTGNGSADSAVSGASNGAAPGAGAVALATGTPQAAANPFASLDADTSGWLQNKGYFGPDLAKADIAKGLAAWVKSDRGLESIVGRNRLAVPKDINDAEAYTALHKALGHPADKAGYEIKMPKGGNQAYQDKMLDVFHQEGLSVRQAQAIAKVSNELVAANNAEREAQFAARSGAELETVRKDWGPQSDQNFAAAQRFTVAAKAAGLDKPMMEKIERAIGTKAMMNVFAWAGRGLTEDRGTGAGSNGAMPVSSVEGARAQLKDLRADKDWVKRQQGGGATENRELERLLGIVADSMG